MKTTISTLALLVGLTLFGSARAERSPEYELGVFGGGHLWNPDGGVGRITSAEDNQVHHGGLFGIRLGIGLHPRFFLEAELGLAPSSTKGEPSTPGLRDPAQVFGVGYRLNGLFHILTGRIRPYVLLGVGGFSTTSSDASVFLQDTTYSLGAGGGLKFDVGSSWGIRLDGRALLHKGLPDGAVMVPDGEVSLGVFGRFGNVKSPPPLSISDRDRDGITDAMDRCPDVPGPPIHRGCPEGAGPLPPPPAIPPEPTAAPPLPPLPAPAANQ